MSNTKPIDPARAKEAVRTWISDNRKALGVGDFTLRDSSTGKSNFTYIVESEQKYIVRMNRPPSEDLLEHEARMLDFLHENGIEQIPKTHAFEPNGPMGQSIAVQTFVGEHELDQRNPTEGQVDALAKTLGRLRSVSVEAYDRAFGTTTRRHQPLRSYLEERFEEHSQKPYEKYLSLTSKPDKRLLPLFEKQKRLLQEAESIKSPMMFTVAHRDLANNIRISSDDIYIVDWELGGVASPVAEIQHFFNIARITAERQKDYIEAIQRYYPLGDYEEKRDVLSKFMMFNDLVWAAQRLETLRLHGEDLNEMHELFEERLKSLEAAWASDL